VGVVIRVLKQNLQGVTQTGTNISGTGNPGVIQGHNFSLSNNIFQRHSFNAIAPGS
jgi:hypothetical protein